MGLTGFNKRRREAAALSRARTGSEPHMTTPASPLLKKAEDVAAEPETVHKANKKKPKAGINENSKID